jgi:hypothetical protein
MHETRKAGAVLPSNAPLRPAVAAAFGVAVQAVLTDVSPKTNEAAPYSP